MDPSITDLTTLWAAPATGPDPRYGRVTIDSEGDSVIIRVPSAVQWHRQTDGSIVEPGALCLPPATLMWFIDAIATRVESQCHGRWPDGQFAIPDSLPDTLTELYLSLFRTLRLDQEGNYIRTPYQMLNGTDEEPTLVKKQLSLPFNTETVRFRTTTGAFDHHRITYMRQSMDPVDSRWTFTTTGPGVDRYLYWSGYHTRLFVMI